MDKVRCSTPSSRLYRTSGEPNSWPRKVARKQRRLPDALSDLIAAMDDANQRYALQEFIEERIRMAKGLK